MLSIRRNSTAYSTNIGRSEKARDEVVTGFFDGNSLNVRTEAAGFVRYDCADAVNGRFIGRGRFGFDQSFE
jgi:hypothetical protein